MEGLNNSISKPAPLLHDDHSDNRIHSLDPKIRPQVLHPRVDLHRHRSKGDPRVYHWPFRIAVQAPSSCTARVFESENPSPLVNEISEHLIPGSRLGPSRRYGPLLARSTASTQHQREPEFPHSRVRASTGICSFTALQTDSTSLLATLVATSFIHAASSPETVVHRLGALNIINLPARASEVHNISTIHPRHSLTAQCPFCLRSNTDS